MNEVGNCHICDRVIRRRYPARETYFMLYTPNLIVQNTEQANVLPAPFPGFGATIPVLVPSYQVAGTNVISSGIRRQVLHVFQQYVMI
ncbi:MAG: hypothetical protein BWY92_00743 [Firmicutes bacterium ADurb.BinA052]|nr:MAG: hypothetical protein BWY92_00743 [Firmicutes bacterium ADurb.BinA052]